MVRVGPHDDARSSSQVMVARSPAGVIRPRLADRRQFGIEADWGRDVHPNREQRWHAATGMVAGAGPANQVARRQRYSAYQVPGGPGNPASHVSIGTAHVIEVGRSKVPSGMAMARAARFVASASRDQ